MDKNKERRAFDRTYGHRNSWTVIPGEAPDFLCERSGAIVLGVEVTQIWLHETDARLANIDGYALRLLDGGRILHKDDAAHILVDKVKILPPGSDMPEAEVDALIQEHPTPVEKSAALYAAVAHKASKIDAYRSRCPVVDLVVEDASTLFWFEEFQSLLRPISGSEFRADLLAAPFREVFLLTHNGEKGAPTCVPLKASLLMEDLLVLEKLFSAEEEARSIYESPSDANIIFSALAQIGHCDLLTCNVDGRPGLAIGAYTVHWSSTGKVIRDYSNWPASMPTVSRISDITLSAADAALSSAIAEKRGEFSASVPIMRRFDDV